MRRFSIKIGHVAAWPCKPLVLFPGIICSSILPVATLYFSHLLGLWVIIKTTKLSDYSKSGICCTVKAWNYILASNVVILELFVIPLMVWKSPQCNNICLNILRLHETAAYINLK